MTSDASPRPVRLAVEVVPVALLLGLFLWDVRTVLQPLVVFPLLFFLLWPARESPLGRRTLVVTSLVFGAWFVMTLGSVLTPFAMAFGIAYLLAPAVTWLERHKVRRSLAIMMVLLPFLGALVGLLLLLVPEIERQLLELVSRIPQLAQRFADWAQLLRDRLLSSGSRILPDEQIARLRNLQASDLVGLVSSKWAAIGEHLWTMALGIGRGVGAGLGVVLTVLGYVVALPVVTYYLLKSWPSLMSQTRELVPPAAREPVFGFLDEYDVALGRFVRGQLTEAALVAVLTTVSLALLGFPGAILMGVIAGIGNLIPNVGFVLSLIPGILIALVAPEVGSSLVKLIAVFGVVQFIDTSVTGPKIVGGSVGLNPVWVMMAVLVFGSLFGIIGMFLSVPLAVLVKLLVVRAVAKYRGSVLYTG